jgi:transcriptional regulator with XRE-family HTH domain
VDTKQEIQEFLTSRRARITPAQAGVRTFGSGPRRVPGLRREEVASLAGVSIAYYTKLERGDASGVSDTVLEALSRALQLDDAERSHLFDLVRAQQPVARMRRRRSAPPTIRPSVQRLLDRIDAPAYIRNARMDIVAMNKLGEALYSEILGNPRRPANTARFCFLDPRATAFYIDWDESADASVAVLRAEAGRNPHDQELTNLIGELSTQSEDFRVRWARHDVGTHDAGLKRLHHPLVGRLELTYEGMTLAADPDLVLFAFTAEVGSRSEEALNLLASWTATPDEESTDADHQEQPRHERRS